MAHPPLLLLHGALGASSQFRPLLPHLHDALDVRTPDFEGHGASPLRERAFRFSHFAENVIDYLDNNAIGETHVFGHSMGGHVGLYLARFFPERVKSIFTLGTKFTWTPEIAAKENAFLDPDKMRAKVPHYVQTLRERHIAADWETLLEKIKEQHLYLGQNNPLGEADMQQIHQRVRIGLGDRDKMAGLDESVRAYQLLPNGEFQIFPATPHPLKKVSMPRLASGILDFLLT